MTKSETLVGSIRQLSDTSPLNTVLKSHRPKKQIFLFGNSMCYTPEGQSYLDMLKDRYEVGGLWMTGMTIWHVAKYAKGIVQGEAPVIINVGVSEATTRTAILDFENKVERFYNLMPIYLFANLFHMVIHSKFRPIIIGVPKPNNDKFTDRRIAICKEYNDLIREIASCPFIDPWDYSMTDEAHLTQAGHEQVFKSIMEVI